MAAVDVLDELINGGGQLLLLKLALVLVLLPKWQLVLVLLQVLLNLPLLLWLEVLGP
jgi:hypothetical protein